MQALRSLLSVLDDRGTREALLIDSLEKREAFLCQEMSSRMVNDTEIRHSTQSDQSGLEIVREESSSPVSDVDNNLSQIDITKDSLPSRGAIVLEAGKKGEEENWKWRRLQEFDTWIWNYFYCDLNAVKHSKRSYFESLARCEACHDLYWRDEKHCKICHMTFELDFDLEERYAIHSVTCRVKGDMFPRHKVLSSQLQSLKAAVHAIEVLSMADFYLCITTSLYEWLCVYACICLFLSLYVCLGMCDDVQMRDGCLTIASISRTYEEDLRVQYFLISIFTYM